MEEQPPEPPQQDSGERPQVFGNVNGWIAGVTGLVVALGGLFTAYDRMWGDQPAEPQAVAATAPPASEPRAEPAAAVPAAAAEMPARPKIYTGELFADGSFEGGAMSLRHDGENWILTADQRYVYEQLAASNSEQIRAYNRDYDSYLRWPASGGEVEEKIGTAGWNSYARVAASEASSR